MKRSWAWIWKEARDTTQKKTAIILLPNKASCLGEISYSEEKLYHLTALLPMSSGLTFTEGKNN